MSGLMNSNGESYEDMVARIHRDKDNENRTQLFNTAPSLASSICHAPSEMSTEFKLPGPPINRVWFKYSARIRTYVRLLEKLDKKMILLACRILEEIVDFNQPVSNPADVLSIVFQLVRDKHYSSNIAPSLSSASISSAEGNLRTANFVRDHSSVLSATMAREDRMELLSQASTSFASNQWRPPGQNPPQNAFDEVLHAAEQLGMQNVNNYSRAAPLRHDESMATSFAGLRREESIMGTTHWRQPGRPPMRRAVVSMQQLPPPQRPTQQQRQPGQQPRQPAQQPRQPAQQPRLLAPPPDTPRTRARNRRPAALPGPASSVRKIMQETPVMNVKNNNEERVTVTRAGRRVKTPVSYWAGNNTSCFETSQQPRGKQSNMKDQGNTRKAVKATPLRRPNKTTPPLTRIDEGNAAQSKPKQKQNTNKNISVEDKENVEVGNPGEVTKAQTKIVKKPNSRNNSKNESKLTEKDKSSASTKQKSAKVGRKRKSGDAENSKDSAPMIQKRKKLESPKVPEASKDQEDNVHGESSDDELFAIPRRLKGFNASMVVSPSAGILSAKKALSGATSKETPPCKSLYQMLNMSRASEAMSAGSDLPKAKSMHATKRVAKNVEKSQKVNKSRNTASKKQVQVKKEMMSLGTLKEKNGTYAMFLSEEEEGDDDEDSLDSDVDDDLN